MYLFVSNNPVNRLDPLGLDDTEAEKQLKKQEEDFLRQPIPRISKPAKESVEQKAESASSGGWVVDPNTGRKVRASALGTTPKAKDYTPMSPEGGSAGLPNISGSPYYDPSKPQGALIPWNEAAPRLVTVHAIVADPKRLEKRLDATSDAQIAASGEGERFAVSIEARSVTQGGQRVPITESRYKDAVLKMPGKWQILRKVEGSDRVEVVAEGGLDWKQSANMLQSFTAGTSSNTITMPYVGGNTQIDQPGVYTARLVLDQQPTPYNWDVNVKVTK